MKYINQLTDKEIINLLKKCELYPFSIKNEKLIHRGNKNILVRCATKKALQTDGTLDLKDLNERLKYGLYDAMDLVELVFIEDYFVYTGLSSINEAERNIDTKLNSTILQYLYDRFGEEFYNDFNNFYKNLKQEKEDDLVK